MSILYVNESNFNEEVLQADHPVLVDFYADWCSHCRTISPLLEQLSEEKSIQIAKVNVDESPDLSKEYKIMAIPALILFEGGRATARKTGSVSKKEILEILP